jgi:hypothetical protein
MSRPRTKAELLDRSAADYARLMASVVEIPQERRTSASAYPRGSLKDMLAHLDAWHELLLEWERVGRTGLVPPIPAEGYTWKTLPDFNLTIHDAHADDPWDDVVARLDDSHARVHEVIASYDADELFEKKRYRWTGSTSVGSYAVSATTSHYEWAMKLLRQSTKLWAAEDEA